MSGKNQIEILNEEFSVLEEEPQLAAVQGFTERAPQHGQQHFSFQISRGRMPVNIEIGREYGFAAVFEYIHPPAILGAGRHVVRNDIQYQPHPVIEQCILELLEFLRCADVRIYLGGVGRVITVPAAFAACKNGRGVDIRDPEFRQIINETGRVRQPEIGIELKPVRCDWEGTFSHRLAQGLRILSLSLTSDK